MKSFRGGSLQLHVRIVGEGSPLLLLHGFTGNGTSWPAPLLEDLGRFARVAVVDLPGHGETGIAGDHTITLERTIESLNEVQEDAFGGPASWMGYSMGGRIALSAAMRGTPITRLFLESSSPGIMDPTERARRRAQDESRASDIDERGLAAFLDEWEAQGLFASQTSLPATTRQAVRAARERGSAAGLSAALRGLGTGAQPSWWEALPSLMIPVSLLTGGLDEKFVAIGDRMTGLIHDARHQSVDGAGHTIHLERPDRWLAWLREGLQRRLDVPLP